MRFVRYDFYSSNGTGGLRRRTSYNSDRTQSDNQASSNQGPGQTVYLITSREELQRYLEELAFIEYLRKWGTVPPNGTKVPAPPTSSKTKWKIREKGKLV